MPPPRNAYAYSALQSTGMFASKVTILGNPYRTGMTNTVLLTKMEERLSGMHVLPMKTEELSISENPPFPGNNFRMTAEEGQVLFMYSLFARNQLETNRMKRLINYPRIVCECFFLRFPKLLVWRILDAF